MPSDPYVPRCAVTMEDRGPVAWTRYRNEGVLRTGEEGIRLGWLERAAVLEMDGGWRIDRLQSAPVRRVGPE